MTEFRKFDAVVSPRGQIGMIDWVSGGYSRIYRGTQGAPAPTHGG